MLSRERVVPLILCLAVLSLAPAVRADPIVFFGQDTGLGEGTRVPARPNSDTARNNFLANLSGVGTETFESFPNGRQPPIGLVFPGAGMATLTGSGNVMTVLVGTNGAGRYPISGNNYYESGLAFAIDFSAPVAAFGFYATDIGDFNGQLTLSLLRTDGTTLTLTVPHTVNGPGGGVIYFGLIDTANPFTRITFGNTAAGTDFFGFDDMTIGSAQQVSSVPEPATLLLLGTGVVGLAARFRRRRKSC